MDSSSGTSSGSSSLNQTSCSDGDLQAVLDQRKRKRMISNRESARRSRMRKQKQLDELIVQSGQLRNENQRIASSIAVTTQHYLSLEAENSVLRAQLSELQHRLEALNDIVSFLSPMGGDAGSGSHGGFGMGQLGFESIINQQPLMASSSDLFRC